jgi:hypothetical protein
MAARVADRSGLGDAESVESFRPRFPAERRLQRFSV